MSSVVQKNADVHSEGDRQVIGVCVCVCVCVLCVLCVCAVCVVCCVCVYFVRMCQIFAEGTSHAGRIF